MEADSANNTATATATGLQHQFERHWPTLTQAHVRNLAWLLDAPDLLQRDHPRWQGRLAHPTVVDAATADWLIKLNQDPHALITFLALHPHTRLGHYAENLLAFYFSWRGELAAHSLQVRSHTTIGEFDFLLNTPVGLQHWEFACKFYLLSTPSVGTSPDEIRPFSDYVGPNLADNLGDKIHKIMDVQLALGKHPAAQSYLTAPLVAAKAWLKGWLFYPAEDTLPLDGIAPEHCRGVWCHIAALSSTISKSAHAGTKSELKPASTYFHILPRLNWLAPAKIPRSEGCHLYELQQQLQRTFQTDSRPVLIAQCTEANGVLTEYQRLFIVPDGWGALPE